MYFALVGCSIFKILTLSIVLLAFSQFFDIMATKYLLGTEYFIEYNPLINYIFVNYCYEVGLLLKLSIVYVIWINRYEIKTVWVKWLLFSVITSYLILNIYQSYSIISIIITEILYGH